MARRRKVMRPKAFILPDGFETFLVKRVGPFRFDVEPGTINEDGQYVYTTRSRERVWACSGECNVTQAFDGSIEIGQVAAGSTIHAVMIDDDIDDRVAWWAADEPRTQTAFVQDEGMTVYLDYTAPFDAFWYLTSEDSVGVVKICIE